MITTLKDKEVNITWKETGSVQTVIIRSIDLMNDWVCLQNVEGDRLMFWARLEDMDVIQVNQIDYDPNSTEGLFGINGEVPSNVKSSLTGDLTKNGESFIKASMEFLLPQSAPEFYMATNAPNAFSAIYKIMELLEEGNDEANRSEEKDIANKLAVIREKAHNILVEFGVDFDEDEKE